MRRASRAPLLFVVALSGIGAASAAGVPLGAQALAAQQETDAASVVARGVAERSGAAREAMVRLVMTPGPQGQAARDALRDLARGSDDAMMVATAMGLLVRYANQHPGEVASVVSTLTEFVRDAPYVKRAITVDALENLPAAGRAAMVPVLASRARSGGDTPSTRLYLRGLWELGPEGLQEIQGMVNDGALSGDALTWARYYLREGS